MINTDETIADAFKRMHHSLTDHEQREERARATERKKRIEERKRDTGAYVV